MIDINEKMIMSQGRPCLEEWVVLVCLGRVVIVV